MAARPNAHWLVVATVCIGAFMGQLDASIVVIAFPTMQHDFHSHLGAVEWVSVGYLLVLVAMVTAVGRFADMVGRKLLYIYGFGIFIIGTALCAVAPNLPTLIVFRLIQGFGAAMLQANSVALIVQAMPPEKLGRGIGVQGAAQALGLALGPAVGGFLLALGGWRLIFWVNVPAGVLGMALGWFLLPRSRHLAERRPIDWRGLGMFIVAVTGLLLAVTFGDESGWTSPPILIYFALLVVFGALFLRWESRSPAPMMDLSIFHRIPFSAGIGSGLLSYLVLFGTLFVGPYYLRTVGHMSPSAAGLNLLVLPLALGVTAPFAGRLADRVGARPLTVAGMVLTCASLLAIGLHHTTGAELLLELAAAGVGLGAFTPPNNAAIMGAAPRQHSGMASGILNMTRGLGTSMGVALTGLVFGLAAGTSAAHAESAPLVANGFGAAVLFLAGAALLAAVVAAIRGRSGLSSDPTLTAEG